MNEITAKVEDRKRAYEAARTAVVDLLLKDPDRPLDEVAKHLNGVAHAQEVHHAYAFAAHLLDEGHPPLRVYQALTDLVLNGANDDYSGRANDIRRAGFEGRRQAVRDLGFDLGVR